VALFRLITKLPLLRKKWSVTLIGFTALAVILVLAGPLLEINGHQPLRDPLVRVLGVILLFMLWGLLILLDQLRSQRRDEALVEEVKEDADDEEVSVLADRLQEAIARLRSQAKAGRLSAHFLYELPWFIIIGPPGSGKTTALMNAGLAFPTGGKGIGETAKVEGAGGTRSCDWWFTQEAVLLDTAGRYTTQDYGKDRNHQAWIGFLQLLKRHRPRRPINGIIIAIALPDLMAMEDSERYAHVDAIRSRIDELYQELGLRFPIYLMFTKCDLVVGFVEFFDDLDREQRKQLFGVTFELDLPPEKVRERFWQELDGLMVRIQERMLGRLAQEADSRARVAKIHNYPQQMRAQMERLVDLVESLFRADRFGVRPWLRGVYFTSGTQEGNPIDRLVSRVLQSSPLAEDAAASSGGRGRSYFLTRLFEDVLFRESEIAGTNRAAERRRTLLQYGLWGTSAILLLILGWGWHATFAYKHHVAEATQNQLDEATAGVEKYNSGQQDITRVLGILDPLAAGAQIARSESLSPDGAAPTDSNGIPTQPPFTLPVALHRGADLAKPAEAAYHRGLHRYLTPLLLGSMERRMRENSENAELLYETLKAYLPFGDANMIESGVPEPRKALIQIWAELEWERELPYDRAARERLSGHLKALLDRAMEPTELDDYRIAEARRIITQIPLAQRAYWRLRDETETAGLATPFSLADELGLGGRELFLSRTEGGLERVIPALYTYKGFTKAVLPGLDNLVAEAIEEERRMIGQPTEDTRLLRRDVLDLYYRDYVDHWNDLLEDLQVVKFHTLEQAQDILEVLSASDSPLLRLLSAVEQNTRLASRQEEEAAEPVGGDAGEGASGRDLSAISRKAEKARQRLMRLRREEWVNGQEPPELPTSGTAVEGEFERLNELFQGEGGSRPIDAIIVELDELSTSFTEMARARVFPGAGGDELIRREGERAYQTIRSLQGESTELPNPLQGWVLTIADHAKGILEGSAAQQLNQDWLTVYRAYQRAVEGRYPTFKEASQEAKMADFERFFGPGGQLDLFLRENLDPPQEMLQHTQPPEAYRQLGLSRATFNQLRRAALIQEKLFRFDGGALGAAFSMTPIEMDPRLTSATLLVGDKRVTYRHQAPTTQNFQWPVGGSNRISVLMEKRDGQRLQRRYTGDWALFRMLDNAQLVPKSADEFRLTLIIDGFEWVLRLSAESVDNPFTAIEVVQGFRCPDKLSDLEP
jgi:type VI secretion system protein ImpL